MCQDYLAIRRAAEARFVAESCWARYLRLVNTCGSDKKKVSY